MSRQLYLNFSQNTAMKSANTSAFTLKTLYFSGSPINLINSNDSTYYVYSSDGYDVAWNSGSTNNYIIWERGLYNQLSGTTTVTGLTYSTFNGANYPISITPGAGLLDISTTGMCTTTVYGEVTSVTPAADSVDTSIDPTWGSYYTGSGLNYTAYTHQDLIQVSNVNNTTGAPQLPAIVIRAFNTNFDAASGDTVTATLQVTGVTYVSGGTGTTTTYTDAMTVTFDRQVSPPSGHGTDGDRTSPATQHYTQIYDYLPGLGIGLHRGTWTFKLSVSTNNSSTGHNSNKYVRAFLINNG
jgi:hypothetical protein